MEELELPYECADSVELLINHVQWDQLVDELFLQLGVSADDELSSNAEVRAMCDALVNLILEKLHLKDVYAALADGEFYDENNVTDDYHDMASFISNNAQNYRKLSNWKFCDQSEATHESFLIEPRMAFPTSETEEGYLLEYEGNQYTMDGVELAKRTSYVINTYGDHNYFSMASVGAIDRDITDQTTVAETTTTTTETTTINTDATAGTTTNASGVATGETSVTYLLFAGSCAAATALLTKKKKRSE